MVTQLESRFLPNESTRVTINDSSQSHCYLISKHVIDKPSWFAHKIINFFCFSDDQFWRKWCP